MEERPVGDYEQRVCDDEGFIVINWLPHRLSEAVNEVRRYARNEEEFISGIQRRCFRITDKQLFLSIYWRIDNYERENNHYLRGVRRRSSGKFRERN